jgi:hypothetical protein
MISLSASAPGQLTRGLARGVVAEKGMTVVKGPRGPATWARRGILAIVLVGAAIIPGRATSQPTRHCSGHRCQTAGSILWTRALSGSWIAEDGVAGTSPASGEAYVASAGNLAVLAHGTSVTGYQALTGQPAWHADLTAFPPGAAIVSVRAWPAVVAVGVAVPNTQGGQNWYEAILSAATGDQLRSYRVAEFGGAVRADKASTVIVGARAVTSYANATGRVIWTRSTGKVAQAWTIDGPYLYIAETSGGYLSSSPITALHRIDMRTGAMRAIRPPRGHFTGTLAGIVGEVALFTGTGGLSGYNVLSGQPLWQHPYVLELIDRSSAAVYVSTGNGLTALNLSTGHTRGRPVSALSASLYAIRGGVALGLDQGQGSLGEAWGYDIARRKVVWTSTALPWPHFFVDLTGLGGSVSSAGNLTLLTTCAAEGAARGSNASRRCLRPELAAIRY